MSIVAPTCHFLTLERLIQLKRAAGRPKELEVLSELQALLEERRRQRELWISSIRLCCLSSASRLPSVSRDSLPAQSCHHQPYADSRDLAIPGEVPGR